MRAYALISTKRVEQLECGDLVLTQPDEDEVIRLTSLPHKVSDGSVIFRTLDAEWQEYSSMYQTVAVFTEIDLPEELQ